MTHIELEEAEKMIDSALKRVVHTISPEAKSKLDALTDAVEKLSKKLDEHIDQHDRDTKEREKSSKELKDMLVAYNTAAQIVTSGKFLGSLLKWSAGVVGAWLIIRGIISGKL